MKLKRQRPMPTGRDSPTVVYHDALLRRLLVVEHRGELWLCPRRPGGWSSRQRLQMTEAALSERLRPARDVTPAWLGVE